jgi:gas vesicle protein
MNRILSFAAGALCGALCGAVAAILLAPASGDELVDTARNRWEEAKHEAKVAMVAREQELQAEFEQLKRTP